MAYTTINKGSSYFNTKLYTGTGAAQSITGVGFKPDWVWMKHRNSGSAYNHQLDDAVRLAGRYISSNVDSAEDTDANTLSSFNSDGFSLGSNIGINESGVNYVSWNWLANNTTGSSNTDGSITSTVAANTTAGFSIVKWTGNNTSGATVGHGLGSVLKMIIVKNLNTTDSWNVYHVSNGNTKRIFLNTTGSTDTTASAWNNTTPTSSVFTIGNNTGVNNSGSNLIAYCFADIKGYSSFGSYTGNGSTNGPFIYTGFKPAFLIAKRTDSTGNWRTRDDVRSPYNPVELVLYPNSTATEVTEDTHDFLSNGFKVRTTGPENNANGGNFIYMAFAENPFVTSGGIPVTAR